MAWGYNVMEVHPSVPATSIKELIALAKAKPGTLNFASAGNGNTSHLCGELLKQMAGIDIVHVPYKGNGPAGNDLIAGHVQILFESTISAAPKIKAGTVRALAVTAPKRLAALPNIPTFAEAGLPGMEVYVFFTIVAPKKTSKEIIMKLNKEIDRVLHQPEVSDKIEKLGFEPVLGSTPEQLDAFLKAERTKWKKVIENANIKVE
jgi:tripartite-type tricarboxylate transporter receptor subunit TctC